MTKTINDVVEEILKEINDTDIKKTDKEVINSLKALLRELNGTGISGKDFRLYNADELSRIAGSMANLKASLAEIHARAQRNMRVADASIKLKKGNLREPIIAEVQRSKGKVNEGDIKAEIDRRIFKDRIRLAFKEEFSEQVIYTWRASIKMIDVLLSRINVLQSQKSDTNILDDGVAFDLPHEEKEDTSKSNDVPEWLKQ